MKTKIPNRNKHTGTSTHIVSYEMWTAKYLLKNLNDKLNAENQLVLKNYQKNVNFVCFKLEVYSCRKSNFRGFKFRRYS